MEVLVVRLGVAKIVYDDRKGTRHTIYERQYEDQYGQLIKAQLDDEVKFYVTE